MEPEDFPLREVPDRFFEPELWSKLKLAFAVVSKANALEALRPDPSPMFADARRVLAGRESPAVAATSRVAELRDQLLSDLKAKLQSRELVGTGLLPSNPVPTPIPASLWIDLVINIPDEIAEGAGYRFQRVRIGRLWPIAQTLASKCRDWMQAQSPDFEKLAKKEILHLAKKEFGTELTVRDFNASYREIFQRPRGRPPKQADKD